MQDSVYSYLEQIAGLMSSAAGIVGFLIAIALLIYLGMFPRARWVVLALFIFISTFDVGSTADDLLQKMEFRQLPFPMEAVRAHARLLEVLFGALMVVPLFKSIRGWRSTLVPMPLLFFAVLNIWMSLRLIPDQSSMARGVLSLVSYALLFLTLGVGIARSLQTMDDAYDFIKSFVGVAVIFVVANVYYVLRNPAASQGRFWGTTPNPQSVGQVVALLLPPLLCLVQSTRLKIQQKIALWSVAGLLVIFLLWSGSRTGALMAGIGMLFFYRAQVGRALWAFLLGGLVTLAAVIIFPQSLVVIDRFTDPTNSRAEAWADLMGLFWQNPVFGVTFQGTGYGESLYLATLANYGIIGALPLALFVIFLIFSMVRLYLRRKLLGAHAILAEVLIAEMAMILIASVFESSLLGVWNVVTLMLYLNCALLGFLNDYIRASAAETESPLELPGRGVSLQLQA